MSTTTQEILHDIESGAAVDVLSTPLSSEEADALVTRAKSDPGAPFEALMLARLAMTKRMDLAMFMRLRARLKEAKANIGELDRALTKHELQGQGQTIGNEDEADGQGRAISFEEIEPWSDPVNGGALLGEIVVGVQTYVVLPREAAVAVALWIVHAYCFMLFDNSARLAILSPEKRCGKTTLLGFIQALVPKALSAVNITSAAMFRTIAKYRPTLLIDEADTFLPDNEELRGVINSGHQSSGQVIRLVGDNHDPRAFSTYCPTVIAAIGSLPGTVEDRAITIPMRRRLAGENVTRFRNAPAGALTELAQKIARWVADHEEALRDADPEMPDELNDRACDNWRAPLAIADLAGDDWPQQARSAALTLAALGAEQNEQSRGAMLLADIRLVFVAGSLDPISSTALAAALERLTDRPWATWTRGKPITPAAIARLLKTFGIVPTTIKLPDGKQPNGYRRRQFEDAFERYLPQPPVLSAETSPPSPIPAESELSGESESSPGESVGELSGVREGLEKYGIGEEGELLHLEPGASVENDDGADDLLVADLLEQLMQSTFRSEAAAADADT